jgi:hypothetical protein
MPKKTQKNQRPMEQDAFTKRLSGVVIGHTARFNPRRESRITKVSVHCIDAHLNGWLVLRIDGRIRTVPCPIKDGCITFQGDKRPVPDQSARLIADIAIKYPLMGVVSLIERINTRGEAKYSTYELLGLEAETSEPENVVSTTTEEAEEQLDA